MTPLQATIPAPSEAPDLAYFLHVMMRKGNDDHWSNITWNAVGELPDGIWQLMVEGLADDIRQNGGLTIAALWAWFSNPPEPLGSRTRENYLAHIYLSSGLRCVTYAQVAEFWHSMKGALEYDA